MKDALITVALAVGLAALITVHVGLSVRLCLRLRPRWRGLVAFVVPPLAVIWAFRAGWRKTALLWLGAMALYAGALMAALADART